MPRRKIVRTPEEEAALKNIKRRKNAECKAKTRRNARNNTVKKSEKQEFKTCGTHSTDFDHQKDSITSQNGENAITSHVTFTQQNLESQENVSVTLDEGRNSESDSAKDSIALEKFQKPAERQRYMLHQKKLREDMDDDELNEIEMKKRQKQAQYQQNFIQRQKESRENMEKNELNEILSQEREKQNEYQRKYKKCQAELRQEMNQDELQTVMLQERKNNGEYQKTYNLRHTDSRRSAQQKGFSNLDVHDLDIDDVREDYIGSMDILCMYCDAKHFVSEKVRNKVESFHDCCQHGKVQLNRIPEPPTLLRNLLQGSHEQSKHFLDNIRLYNSSFAFASFNANLMNFNERRPGPYCFKIQGQIYYQINTSLYPDQNDVPNYGQLFIVDPDEALTYRIGRNSVLNENLSFSLDQMMRDYNIFAQSYGMMSNELSAQHNIDCDSPNELAFLFSL